MNAVNLLGAAAAFLGLAGICIAFQAAREVLALSRTVRIRTDWPTLGGLFFIAVVDVAMVAAGIAIAIIRI